MSGLQHVDVVGRFAPSPSGRMHIGNLYAYLIAWIVAKRDSGQIVLRIEDLDTSRCTAEYAELLMRDLEALGLTWDKGPYYQSKRTKLYEEAFAEIFCKAHVYPCYCTRADLHAASAPHPGELSVYPGTCRNLDAAKRNDNDQKITSSGRRASFRLEVPDETVSFPDLFQGQCSYHLPSQCGDFVLKRSDGSFAYQLAVVVDDADLGVNSIVRGADLLSSTAWQIHLQRLLGYETPTYGHIPLLVDKTGVRIAKRHGSAQVCDMLTSGESPESVLGKVAHAAGITATASPVKPEELLEQANLNSLHNKQSVRWHAQAS